MQTLPTTQSQDHIAQIVTHLRSADEGERATAFLAAFVVVSAVALYAAERQGDGEIRSLGDALWNATTTVASVGESGCPPVTPAGRIIGALLIIIGSPLFDTYKAQAQRLLARLTEGPATGERRTLEAQLLEKVDELIVLLRQYLPTECT